MVPWSPDLTPCYKNCSRGNIWALIPPPLNPLNHFPTHLSYHLSSETPKHTFSHLRSSHGNAGVRLDMKNDSYCLLYMQILSQILKTRSRRFRENANMQNSSALQAEGYGNSKGIISIPMLLWWTDSPSRPCHLHSKFFLWRLNEIYWSWKKCCEQNSLFPLWLSNKKQINIESLSLINAYTVQTEIWR